MSWAADPPGALVYGPTLTAEVSGGPVVLRVLAVHTAEAVYLGMEARIYTCLLYTSDAADDCWSV